MLTTLGALLLLFSAVCLGYGIRAAKLRSLRAQRCALALVRHAREKIHLYNTPLKEIWLDFSDKEYGFHLPFDRTAPHEAVAVLLADLPDRGDGLLRFIDACGMSYSEDARCLCDNTLRFMSDEVEKAERTFAAEARLAMALPILIAVSLIVLFV